MVAGGKRSLEVLRRCATQVELDIGTWPLPAVFRWITSTRRVAPEEMLRTFNCGIGMVVIVPQESAEAAVAAVEAAGEDCVRIGRVVARSAGSAQVTFSAQQVTAETILASPRRRRRPGFAAAAAAAVGGV